MLYGRWELQVGLRTCICFSIAQRADEFTCRLFRRGQEDHSFEDALPVEGHWEFCRLVCPGWQSWAETVSWVGLARFAPQWAW